MICQNANTARIGIYGVASIVSQDLKWIFREQFTEDYGIDAHIEVCTDGKPTGRLIAAQIKCGESWFSSASEEGFVYSGTLRHLEYWISHSLPVILILYHPVLKQALWVPVESERIRRAEERWQITVPFQSYFDKNAAEKLRSLALPDYRKRKEIKEITNNPLQQAAGVGALLDRQAAGIGVLLDEKTTGMGVLLDALNKAEFCLDMVFPYIDAAFFWIVKTLSHRIRIRLVIGSATAEVDDEIRQFSAESPGLEIKIYMPRDGVGQLHSKFLIMDDRIAVYGSANFTRRSWREAREVVLAADEPSIVEEFREEFSKLWMDPPGIEGGDNVKFLRKIEPGDTIEIRSEVRDCLTGKYIVR